MPIKADNTAVVTLKKLEAVPTTKTVAVTYKTSTGVQVGLVERVTVAADAEEIDVADLKKIPEGYRVVGKVEIDEKYATATVEAIPAEDPYATRDVTVEFVCGEEEFEDFIVTGVMKSINTLYTNIVDIPEGYEAVEEFVPIKSDNTAVVTLKKLEAVPTTKLITVTYKTSTGVQVGLVERVTVAADATEIPVADLKKIPEGYRVVGKVEIDKQFATATVEAIPTEDPYATRDVTVEFVCGDEEFENFIVTGVMKKINTLYTSIV